MNSTINQDLNVKNITSVECFNKLSEISNSYLIDVRTEPEWEFIGVPDLSSINKKLYVKKQINNWCETHDYSLFLIVNTFLVNCS